MARSRSDAGSELYRAIYKVVRRIPRGRVATYGQVAALAGLGGQPRLVGYALHAIEPALEPRAATIPWYRVINAQGRVSFRAEAGCGHEQRERLEREGVTFDDRDRVALDRYRWKPRTRPETEGLKAANGDRFISCTSWVDFVRVAQCGVAARVNAPRAPARSRPRSSCRCG